MLKRLIRIYPIYWVIAAVSLLFLLMGSKNISDSVLSGNIFRPVYLLKSFLLVAQDSYPFVKVAWSLCYEMFFYVMFGLCILFGRRTGLIFIFGYLVLLSCHVSNLFFIAENSSLSFPSSGYNLEFLIGILVAWCFKRVESNPVSIFANQWMARLFLGAGLVMFVAAWRHSLEFLPNFSKFSIYTRIFYGAAAGLIVFGIANLKLTKVNRVTSLFLLLGDASYVLYLVHPLVLAIFFKMILKMGFYGTPVLNYGVSLFALLVCVITGVLMHKKVEAVMLHFLNFRFVRKFYVPVRSSSKFSR
jgi:exopolysaccharide production protein ExoZ